MESITRQINERSRLTYYMYVTLTLVVTYYIVSSVRAYWRLRHFKGPRLAAWSFIWHAHAVTTGRAHLILSEVNTKYGPLARIGPNTLVTCDEELNRKINSARSGYYRGLFYKAFRFGADVDNVFSEVDNERHRYLRKRVAPGYSGKDNSHLEVDMDAVILTMIKVWKERYVSQGNVTKPVDLATRLQFLTMDIITALSFGEPLGFVESDEDLYEYCATMAKNFPAMFMVSAIPLLNWLLSIPWVQRVMSPSMNDRIGMGKIKAVSQAIIARRFAEAESGKEGGEKRDMTGSFIAHKLTLSEITDGSLLNIFAGSDTTVNILRSGMVSMLTQPRIIHKLQAELDATDVPLDQVISNAKCLDLPYLQACIKESLRFNPAGTGLLPRTVPPEGDYYNGQFIPGGTLIGQCAWNLHRLNFTTYGPDANIFRPERWIEAGEAAKAGDRERLDRMERSHELVFAAGDFKCLGYRIALMELGKVWFEIFRRFDIGFIDGFRPMESNVNFGLFIHEGMWVKLEER